MKKIFSKTLLSNQEGIALVTAVIMSVVIMVMMLGALYLVMQSIGLSGAGKRYATASEAADGAIEAAKDDINQAMWGNTSTTMFQGCSCFTDAIINDNTPCTNNKTLLGTGSTSYSARITIERLYSIVIPGSTIQFPPSASGAPSRAVYYRITSRVTGPNNTSAENSVLYRYTG